MYTMYTNASNNFPSYAHVSSYVVWKVQPKGAPRGVHCPIKRVANISGS